MSRRVTPWLLAALLPGTLVGLLYTFGGASWLGATIGGVAGAALGLLGAVVLDLTRAAFAPPDPEIEELAVAVMVSSEEHEGLRRLHEDLRTQWAPKPDDEPPDRG